MATAVLPVKRFGAAKQRLTAGFDAERRRELVGAMVADVLEAIGEARSIERTIVVSGDPTAQRLAAEAGAEVVPDPGDAGHIEAVQAGIARAEAAGAQCVVLLPGDCPLLDPRELDHLLTGVPERYVAIVPDRHGSGTNGLVLRPPSAIVPAFGEGSRARHIAAARDAGVPFGVETLASLGLDLDTPADVVALTTELMKSPGRARRTAKALGIWSRTVASASPNRAVPFSSQGRERNRAVNELAIRGVEGLPEFTPGMEVGPEIASRAALAEGDVVVISQKVVSKAEGRLRKLSSVLPGSEARRLAAVLGREPALVELVLEESAEVLRAERGVLIVETHSGLVCANAGIDSSNLADPDTVCLLPEDPDASARRIRAALAAASGVAAAAVVIADSFGRAWRLGQVEVAIGCAGLAPLDDWRGRRDLSGHELAATLIAVADEAASAADLVRDKTSRTPAAVVRGLGRYVGAEDGPGAAALRRPREEDLFR